jgi:hypothetical protein
MKQSNLLKRVSEFIPKKFVGLAVSPNVLCVCELVYNVTSKLLV